jgi:hypothetical protein
MDLAATTLKTDRIWQMGRFITIGFSAMILAGGTPMVVAEIEPAAEKIFESYAKFLGGEDAFGEIDTARLTMTMEMPGLGMNMKRTVTFKAPDKVFVDVDIQGYGKMLQGFDGENGWAIDPIQGHRKLAGRELDQLKEETNFKEGLHLTDKYSSAVVVGKGDDGLTIIECVKADNGLKETLYFEEPEGILRKSDYTEDMGPQGSVPVSARVDVYERVGDIRLPMQTSAEMMGTSMRVVITSFEPNVEVDDSIFKMPE